MIRDIAGAAFLAVELDRNCKDTEDECIPKEEERIKLSNRRAAHDRYPRKDEREKREPPHCLPNPAFNKMFAHHMINVDT